MENQNEDHEAFSLIIEEFEGALSAEQALQLKEWRLQSPENERAYQEFYAIKVEVDALANTRQINLDELWENVDASLIERKPLRSINRATAESKRGLMFWMSVAAALVVVLGFFLYLQGSAVQTIETADGSQRRVMLPDGTFLALAENSVVKFNESNFAAKRILKLISGEIFLEIKEDPEHPFKVLSNGVEVRDIGTSFSVMKKEDTLRVFVASGKVVLTAENENAREVLPKHTLSYNYATKAFSASQAEPGTYLAWLNEQLIFNNEDLGTIVNKLREVYNVEIAFQDEQLKKRKLTAPLSYHTVDSALSIISASLQLNISRENEGYEIKK